MSYIAVCLKGLEDISEKEVKGKKILLGRIEFKSFEKSLKGKKQKFDFKSVNKIYKLLKQFTFNLTQKFTTAVYYISKKTVSLPPIYKSTNFNIINHKPPFVLMQLSVIFLRI